MTDAEIEVCIREAEQVNSRSTYGEAARAILNMLRCQIELTRRMQAQLKVMP